MSPLPFPVVNICRPLSFSFPITFARTFTHPSPARMPSQLSGRLIEALPGGLHELSLEENPWKCDCRLYELKQWLLTTRTPLRAPVRCQSTSLISLPIVAPKAMAINTKIDTQQSSNFKAFEASIKGEPHSMAMSNIGGSGSGISIDSLDRTELASAPIDETNSFQHELGSGGNPSIKSSSSSVPSSSTSDLMSSKLQHNSHFFDQLMEEDFVCAPKALNIVGQQEASLLKQSLGNNLSIKSSSSSASLGQRQQQQQQMLPEKLQEIARATNLREIYEYLESTLIQVPPKRLFGNKTQRTLYDVEHKHNGAGEASTSSVANKINSPINVNQELANELFSKTSPPAYNARSKQAGSTPTDFSTPILNSPKAQQKDFVQANEGKFSFSSSPIGQLFSD